MQCGLYDCRICDPTVPFGIQIAALRQYTRVLNRMGSRLQVRERYDDDVGWSVLVVGRDRVGRRVSIEGTPGFAESQLT